MIVNEQADRLGALGRSGGFDAQSKFVEPPDDAFLPFGPEGLSAGDTAWVRFFLRRRPRFCMMLMFRCCCWLICGGTELLFLTMDTC